VKVAKVKVCKSCNVEFEPRKPLQRVCGLVCAVNDARATKIGVHEKARRSELRRRRAALKNRSRWVKEAQTEFNKYIRARDAHLPCISCGATTGQFHAGHYRATGSHPELRFNDFNVHAQCSTCNNHLSGNLVEYRKGLIAKIGIDLVTWLEGPQELSKPNIEDLMFLKSYYKAQAKLLNDQR
jgi:Bacteriophage Lambda NinG protein